MHVKLYNTIIFVFMLCLGTWGICLSNTGPGTMLANTAITVNNESGDKKSSQKEKSDDVDAFAWHFEVGSWWSLDKQTVSVKADADIKVINQEAFSELTKSIETAKQRLDEIISPAIREVIGSNRKNELSVEMKKQDGWMTIKNELNERIFSLISHKSIQFGMEVTKLKVSVK